MPITSEGRVMLLLFVLLAGEKLALVQGVSGSQNDRIEVKAGGLVAREGEPGCAFGVLRLGKGKRTLPYFIVLRHGLGGVGKSESSESVMLEDRKAEVKHTLTLDGKTLVIGHVIEVSADGKKATKEAITLNGKAMEPSKGRVFLVDLTVSPAKVEQRNKLTLPADVGDVTAEKGAAELHRRVLADLAKQDKTIEAFLEGK
jgi:hypothetical protein